MDAVDPRLAAALAVQLERRDAALSAGARQVGWKLGMGTAERIGEGNIFHLGFAVGTFQNRPPPALSARLLVIGERRAAGSVEEVEGRVAAAARLLAAVGEWLRPGDRVLTGSIVQEPVAPGDALVADLAQLGRVGVQIAPLPASSP